jgi:hypothetical protein
LGTTVLLKFDLIPAIVLDLGTPQQQQQQTMQEPQQPVIK